MSEVGTKLDQFLQQLNLGDEFQDDQSLSSTSETTATRSVYGHDRRVRRNSTVLPKPKNLELGELTYLYQDRGKMWEGSTITGDFYGEVGFGFNDYKYSKSSKELAESTIRSLSKYLDEAGGEVQSNENKITATPDPFCTPKITRLLQTELGTLSSSDLDYIVVSTGARDSGAFQESTHNPTKVDFLKQYKTAIQDAARQTSLSPELIGAVILSETRGLDSRIFTPSEMKKMDEHLKKLLISKTIEQMGEDISIKQKEAILVSSFAILISIPTMLSLAQTAEHYLGYAINLNENTRDWAYTFFKDGVSIGLGQRQADSLIDMEVHKEFPELADLDKVRIRTILIEWLLNPEKNILLISWFVRKMADQLSVYNKSKENWLKKFASKFACGEIDLSLFAQEAIHWTPAHVTMIGWKYNTGNIRNIDAMAGKLIWGEMFLYSYSDIVIDGLLER